MNKAVIIARIRRWQAELAEMIEQLNDEGKGGPIVEILQKRGAELEDSIEAIRDKSFIPRGDVSFEPGPVIEEIAEKVRRVKQGVKKLKELKQEKRKIIEEMGED